MKNNLIPNGDYTSIIIKAELIENQIENDHKIKFTNEILEGKYKGKLIIEIINLPRIFYNQYSNQREEEIIRVKIWNTLKQALNIKNSSDTSCFLNIPYKITIKNKINKSGKQVNFIDKHKHL